MTEQGFSVCIFRDKLQNKKFFREKAYDSLFIETPAFDILIEGIILNKKKLLKNSYSSFNDYLITHYADHGWRILQQLEGEFRGYIWDKRKNKMLVFTNPTSTQKVFYSKLEDHIFIDTDLVRLNRTIKESGFSISPDIAAFYQLMVLGSLLENKTPLENIYKVLDGHFLDIDIQNQIITEREYFNISGIEYYKKNKEKALDDIHEVFSDSIKMEYEKDMELNTSHLSLLSGGLDSRMALLYALKNNFDIGCAFCFSQSQYFDEKISRKIAKDYGLNYEFVPLDGGLFLNKIDELTRISEGMTLYTGGIHVHHAINNLTYKDFSIFHSGQIGDGILGGFNSEPRKKNPTEYKIVMNKLFLPKVESDLESAFRNHEKEEIFLLRNLAYNRTVFGAQVFQQKAYQTSPFMTKSFIELAISLPEEWKYKHRFYFEWLSKHCKEAEKYIWERTLMKPDAKWKVFVGDKIVKRSFVQFYNRILKLPQKTSMYPYQYYYDSDIAIQDCYQQYFNNNIDRLENYPELKKDVIRLFSERSFHYKSLAVNILAVFKLYFK
ncbi:asparagine synthase-related protein [Chryseobacterium sp. CT-SW4]|uniref:asparagine synthase-related protein n=1 Tax=Chryseobacterium sp. SW-1 TaxID=3157343 RepID=UPI003B015071